MTDLALEPRNVIPSMSAGLFKATMTGLIVEGEPTLEEWRAYTYGFVCVVKGSLFCLGDLLNYGEKKYGETYSQALDEFNFSLDTLKAIKWVAGKVAPATRLPELSWSHHREVASLPPTQQKVWLAKAKDEGLSRDGLRTELRKEKFKLTTGSNPIYTQFKVVAEIEAIIVAENTGNLAFMFKDAMFGAQFPFYDNELSITKVKVMETEPAYIENE